MGFGRANIEQYHTGQQLIAQLRQRAVKRERGRINGGKLILSLIYFVVW